MVGGVFYMGFWMRIHRSDAGLSLVGSLYYIQRDKILLDVR